MFLTCMRLKVSVSFFTQSCVILSPFARRIFCASFSFDVFVKRSKTFFSFTTNVHDGRTDGKVGALSGQVQSHKSPKTELPDCVDFFYGQGKIPFSLFYLALRFETRVSIVYLAERTSRVQMYQDLYEFCQQFEAK